MGWRRRPYGPYMPSGPPVPAAQGLIDFLTASTDEACLLRDTFVFQARWPEPVGHCLRRGHSCSPEPSRPFRRGLQAGLAFGLAGPRPRLVNTTQNPKTLNPEPLNPDGTESSALTAAA